MAAACAAAGDQGKIFVDSEKHLGENTFAIRDAEEGKEESLARLKMGPAHATLTHSGLRIPPRYGPIGQEQMLRHRSSVLCFFRLLLSAVDVSLLPNEFARSQNPDKENDRFRFTVPPFDSTLSHEC